MEAVYLIVIVFLLRKYCLLLVSLLLLGFCLPGD